MTIWRRPEPGWPCPLAPRPITWRGRRAVRLAWVRQLGAEWLLRLIREPRRLGRRYLLEGPPAYLQLRRGLRVSDLSAGSDSLDRLDR